MHLILLKVHPFTSKVLASERSRRQRRSHQRRSHQRGILALEVSELGQVTELGQVLEAERALEPEVTVKAVLEVAEEWLTEAMESGPVW